MTRGRYYLDLDTTGHGPWGIFSIFFYQGLITWIYHSTHLDSLQQFRVIHRIDAVNYIMIFFRKSFQFNYFMSEYIELNQRGMKILSCQFILIFFLGRGYYIDLYRFKWSHQIFLLFNNLDRPDRPDQPDQPDKPGPVLDLDLDLAKLQVGQVSQSARRLRKGF